MPLFDHLIRPLQRGARAGTWGAASQRIRDKLWQGTLPADDPVKGWGSNGSGLPCAGCDDVILSSDVEHEVEMSDGRALRFHVKCAGLWRVLKQARSRE